MKYIENKCIVSKESLTPCAVGTGVNVYAVHPGVVRTELKRHMNIPLLVMWKIVRPFTKTTVQGAQTSIYCAVEPDLDAESGGYYR